MLYPHAGSTEPDFLLHPANATTHTNSPTPSQHSVANAQPPPASQIAQLWAPVEQLSFDIVEPSASQQPHQFHHNSVVFNTTTTNTAHTNMCTASHTHSSTSGTGITSAGEPSPLSIGSDEQSFIYTTSVADYNRLPVQTSQDYSAECSIFDEVFQIVNQSEFYYNHQRTPSKTTISTVQDLTTDPDDTLAFTLDVADSGGVVDNAYNADGGQCTEIAFGDVMMGAGKLFRFDSQSSAAANSEPMFDYANLLTPAASPLSTHTFVQSQSVGGMDEDENSRTTMVTSNAGDDDDVEVEMEVEDEEQEHECDTGKASECLAFPFTDHNYHDDIPKACKRKLLLDDDEETRVAAEKIPPQLDTLELQTTQTTEQLERLVQLEATTRLAIKQQPQPTMRHRRRVSPLRLTLPLRQVAVSCAAVVVDTPEITKCILDLEESRDFDLISFINSSQVCNAIDLRYL